MFTAIRRGASAASLCLGLMLAALAAAPAVAAPNTAGTWSPVTPWPLIPLHMVLMPDGRVFSFGTKSDGTQTGYFIYDVWDPVGGLNGGHLTLSNGTGTDIFCSSMLVLPQGGNVFIAGGDNWTGSSTTNTGNNNSNLFNYLNNTLTRNNNMNRARWYSTSTVLLNGEVYTQGGSGGTDYPEIRATDGTFRLLTGANTGAYDFQYPRNFLAPDGRVFGYDSTGKMYYINTSGNGSVTTAGQFSGPTSDSASAAMFRPGRILQFGGATNGAVVIDITGGSPLVTPTQSMSSQRRLVNATILADGKVLATGGSSVWNELTNVNNSAEIWNPSTGTWTVGTSGNRARLYHSTAVLMPDATVLVAGGGAPGPQNNTNFEVYYPPYLYDGSYLPDGSPALAPRPTIESAPSVIDIGETFALDFASAPGISRVVMIKTAAVTHSFNMEQRFNELTFTANGSRLMVQAPTRAADAPPGFYMLFVLDTVGTPAVARIVKVNVAATPNPAVTPTLTNPGSQSGQVGTPVSLQLAASDPNGDALGYGASGLPPGLSIGATTGLIAGTPTTVGTYNVVVAASDGVNNDVKSFVWTIGQSAAYTLNPLPSPTTQLAGAATTFAASVTGGTNVRYKWYFDDDTPETAYSASPSITHSFASPGIYYVTVTVLDDSGLLQAQTVVQTVHLPLTANRPAVSANITFEDRTAANDRLWVVNQDNDSVTVFDVVTNTRLAEVTVGSAPRTLAIAPNGEVWVTNKQSSSISVISPATLTVTRTLSLPFASQPFGIAMSPAGGFAYVALEAAGKLLKMDVAGYAQAGSLDVGPNPRHVSVNSTGSPVYVSRFITPPLPGENLATVQTASGGGEVLVVNAASMAAQSTIILRHSDKPDFENQGRGVPNYLGATTLSPDGQSAWVPSKQDNIARGTLRDNRNLDFQNTVRAISSRINITGGAEDYPARLDFDNSGVASAVLFDQQGVYMFVALESSRQVAVVSAHDNWQIFRIDVGRAPQGLALSADGRTLYVSNFMDRTVSVFDLTALLVDGTINVPLRATLAAVGTEKLSATVLKGKQFFYDAKDTRLARDGYMSCATCHNDGGHDGRVWDLTGFGEGLRNTINLRGRAGMGQGFLHWSNNFNEVQDFEGQIRTLAGGNGLMTDAQFTTGTRSQPLGDAKTGVSTDLDALAAYVGSLNAFASSPLRTADGSLSAAAAAGRTVFITKGCATCHAGTAFTSSGSSNPQNIGTVKQPTSGSRLGGTLSGIDVPTLRDAWATAPYLHDGSAPTLGDAIRGHNNVTVSDAELPNLVAYVAQVGNQEAAAPSNTPNTGSGLLGQYFNNMTLSGSVVLQRVEAVNFTWNSASPGTGVNADQFSVRWTGSVEASSTGNFRFQTRSDEGVRLWVNGVQVINNWTAHTAVNNNSANIAMTAGTRYAIVMEFYDNTGTATASLRWKAPGTNSYVVVPASRLYPDSGTPANPAPTVATAAAATPNPVTGSSTSLSVLGADDAGESALVYTWAATSVPAGGAATFATNGSNAAKSTSASFTRAGSYTLSATIRDAGGLTATSSVVVTVQQTLTSIAVTPASATVTVGLTQQFSASARDQFGITLTTQPTFSWSVSGGGNIAASGLFTAGSTAGGPFTVSATSGAVAGTAQVTVSGTPPSPPTVATAAAATPNPVTGASTSLSVLGADDAGEGALIYTWAATSVPTGGAATFSTNGSNAAKSTSASFTRAGSYTLGVTIRDAGGLTTTSSVVVTVQQTLTSIAVTPASATVTVGLTQQFSASARDQFGVTLTTQPAFSWSVTGGGTMAASGLFTAGSTAGGPFTVSATSGAVTGTAQVTVSAVAPQPDVTVDFENLNDGAALTTYGGITWGTGGGGWAVWDGGVTWTKVAYVTSTAKTEVTSTFVIPAGMVLKSLRIATTGAPATVKLSSPGNAESVYTDINGTYKTKTLNWVPAQTITVKVTCTTQYGASDVGFDTIVYGAP